jgi:hypothetical protein
MIGLFTVMDDINHHAMAAKNPRDTIGQNQIIFYQQHMHSHIRHEAITLSFCQKHASGRLIKR